MSVFRCLQSNNSRCTCIYILLIQVAAYTITQMNVTSIRLPTNQTTDILSVRMYVFMSVETRQLTECCLHLLYIHMTQPHPGGCEYDYEDDRCGYTTSHKSNNYDPVRLCVCVHGGGGSGGD